MAKEYKKGTKKIPSYFPVRRPLRALAASRSFGFTVCA